ncbi:MAG: hypothetical protein J6Y11_14630 [Paludibacteraceae bacterium]|nr:hypothetical protein [Paludibacteraceae bacterium]
MYFKKLLLTSSVLLAGISQATTMPMPISGGSATSVALCKDNKVYAWGENENKLDSTSTNILGLDTTVAEYVYKSYYATPMLVDSKGIKFTQVEAGSGSTFLGISDKGVLYSWGMVYDSTIKYKEISPVECGQLKGYNEDGTPGGKYLGNVKKVAGSTSGFIALLNDSTVVISEFFNDVDTARNEQGARINNVVDICAGDNSFFALTADGILYSTGSWNGHGSNQDYTNELKPVLLEMTMEPLKDVVAIGSGDCSSFAVTKDGKAYGWGNGGWGSCTGTGVHKMAYYANPIIAGDYAKISGLDYISNVKQIDGGRGYGAAVTFDGYVLYWGNNEDNGGVAGADTLAREISKPIFLTYEDGSIVNDAVAIECGDNFGFVVNNKNQYFAFGLNDLGQCGVGSDSTTIRYLHPMTFDCELATLCPNIRLLEDTVITCGNESTAISALTSSVLDNHDFSLNWYFNGDKLADTTIICSVDEEGEYKIVMTPYDSLCPSISDYVYVKQNKFTFESIDNDILLTDTTNMKDLDFSFRITSEEETSIILYGDEDCTNPIDTMAINTGDNIISVPGSLVSIEESKANVWAKEVKQTTLLPQEGFNENPMEIFQSYGMIVTSANTATLSSFKVKLKSFLGETQISITPALYRAKFDNGVPNVDMELISTGKVQNYVVDDKGTECIVECGFEIPNNGFYVIGMNIDGTLQIFTQKCPEQNPNNPLFKKSIVDINNIGIEWVGSTANSYSSPNPAIDNCYFDLVFTDIDVSKCGAVELSSNLEIDKTDCINTPSVNDNVEGDKYDIFGRKIINVQPQTIYIKDGKKYILSK